MDRARNFVIPNLCKNSSVLAVVLLTQLFALILTLALYQSHFLQHLGAISMYLHWCVLSSTALLCLLRSYLNDKAGPLAVMTGTFLCLLCFTVTETFAQYALSNFSFDNFDQARFYSYLAIAFIIILLIFRLFSILSILEQRNKVEIRMRLEALQSRIRPHFLFNSLNTISELTSVDPKQAENAIGALAQLFRVSLESDNSFHSLESELSLCRRYVELEHWRLQKRLQFDWQQRVLSPSSWQVPKLILQPLVENAIVHGEREDGGIEVSVDVRETKREISILVENTKGVEQSLANGSGIALDNIKDRLFVLYDDKFSYRVKESDSHYSVLIRFPKQADQLK